MNKVLRTIPEACEQLGIGRSHLYTLLRDGLPSVRLGKSRRIPTAELDAFVRRKLAEEADDDWH